MKQVKFLNEADRPQIKAPYTFTQWCESKGYLHWASTIDDKAAEYAAYLASFPTEKKKVEFTHQLINGKMTPIEGFWKEMVLEGISEVRYEGNYYNEGELFTVTDKNGLKYLCKGHLNSSYY